MVQSGRGPCKPSAACSRPKLLLHPVHVIAMKRRPRVGLRLRAGVAELVDAPDLGSGEQSWGFESLRPHHWQAGPSTMACERPGIWPPLGMAAAMRFEGLEGERRCK